jgi:hypothetical protein
VDNEYLYKVPPVAVGGEHSAPEIRWCLRETVLLDVMTRYSREDETAAFPVAVMEQIELRCKGAHKAPDTVIGVARTALGAEEGLDAVTKCLLTARKAYRRLESRKPPVASQLEPGMTVLVSAIEAQFILYALGFQPGMLDGVYGFETENAVSRFQSRVGYPPTGRLDLQTGALLRNAVFHFSLDPFPYWQFME